MDRFLNKVDKSVIVAAILVLVLIVVSFVASLMWGNDDVNNIDIESDDVAISEEISGESESPESTSGNTYTPSNTTSDLITIDFKGGAFVAEIANTASERLQGLSGRYSLAPSRGMLFVYTTPGYYGIWMKDMNFAIDILWLNEKGTIVDIKDRVSPNTYPRTYTPDKPAKYVLEVASGAVDNNNIKVGQRLNFDHSRLVAY